MVKTLDIDCISYSVKTDIYEGSEKGPVLLTLIGRTSRRTKQRYYEFLPQLARELGITTVIFDYSGHGDSPFDIEDIRPAQNFLEVITVFDWIQNQYPGRDIFVIGSSYGGFMATQLTKYRSFKGLILRAPAIYRPQDFYTPRRDEDKNVTLAFRADAEALSKHPLLARASKFAGNVLLIVHGKDEVIPAQTTDAYADAFRTEKVVMPGITHSLDTATPQQIREYDRVVYEWLQRHIQDK